MIRSVLKRVGVVLVVSIGLLATHDRTTWAADQTDIERAERIQTIRDLARTIFERSQKRAVDAVNQTAAGKENNRRLAELEKACFEAYIARIKLDRPASNQAIMEECLRDARNNNPNAEVIADLRAEFVEEELEALRDSMEGAAAEELRDEVQKWSL